MCREISSMREFEQKALILRLDASKWMVDADQTIVIRAHRDVSADSPWPYSSEPALPSPQREVLIVGCLAAHTAFSCGTEHEWRSQQPVRGDAMVLRSQLAGLLAARGGYAISIGRTHTENSPGLSIIGPESGWLEPEALVEARDIAGIHQGLEAGRAWSYSHVTRTP